MAASNSQTTAKRKTNRTNKTSGTKVSTSGKKAAAGVKTAGSGASSTGKRGPGRPKKETSVPVPQTVQPKESNSLVYRELIILGTAAVCILLFFSNFHLCGKLGEVFYQGQRGGFGLLGYIFPVYLFWAVCFLISNRDSLRAKLKLACSLAVFVLLCGIVELFCSSGFEAVMKPMDYYHQAFLEINGGMAGGWLVSLLYPQIGFFGTFVVLAIAVVMGLVYTTEKSVIIPIRQRSEKIYHTAKEDVDRRREERAECGRLGKKVRGISGAVNLAEEEKWENRESEDGADKDDTAESHVNPDNINGQTADEDTAERQNHFEEESNFWDRMEEFAENDSDNGTGQDKENSGRKKTEKAGNGLTGGFFGRLLKHDQTKEVHIEDSHEPEKKEYFDRQYDKPEEDREIFGELLRAEEPYGTRLFAEEENTFVSESHLTEVTAVNGNNGSTERVYIETEDFGMPVVTMDEEKNSNQEVKRVVTAAGRVIEVETDPSVDPLSAKRAGLSQLEASSFSGKKKGTISENEQLTIYHTMDGQKENGQKAAVSPAEKKKRSKPYVKPPLKFLTKPNGRQGGMTKEDLKNTGMKLEKTLRDFNVKVKVTDYSCGPSVTRYELQPEQGVKVSRIVSLTDDIKLNLAAADIRIEAPIPGKAAVGIEVPNKENLTVFLREVIESEAFCAHPSRLAFAVGRDIGGNIVVADLARMPHLLIAGATGAGKSVCINTLIMSILYKAKPSEVKLIMIDPKVVELSIYNGVPHLMVPVVTDPRKAAGALNWAVAEMTDRYKKFAELNVRDLKGYNEKQKQEAEKEGEAEALPQIVIIVDELSDLMMVAPGEVEDAICRLAQMARAAGIHLVLATQRPSVNVITGLIKANVPSRIAFSVSSGVDSRTIIDMNGAEKLLGKGDMLFYPSGYQKPVRVQGAFVSDTEVSKVVEFLTKNTDTDYNAEMEARLSDTSGDEGGGISQERDVYFAQAAKFIIEKDKASIGMLQRVFKIGFNRAARIMDQLSEAGVVGEEEGTKPRKVLMSQEEFERYAEEYL